MTVVMLAILLSLGTWQVHRLTWKTDLLARIDAGERAPGIALAGTPPPFAKVRVTGRLRQGAVGRYGAEVRDLPSGPAIGAQLVDVLDRTDGPPLIVVEGWVPTGSNPGSLAAPGSERVVEGYVRAPEHAGLFSAADDPAHRTFYTLDPAVIGPALGAPDAAPFVLVRLGPPSGAGFPAAATALPRPPNDHLSYAITWFSFAGILLVIFGLYARKALRP